MRHDMKRVIISRPRVGWSGTKHPKGYTKALSKMARTDWDELPSKESMTKRWGYELKDVTDLLGPLRRYIGSQVGRPWDQVWSEICEHADPRSITGNHLREHAERYVEQDVIYENGKMYNARLRSYYNGELIELRHDDFYVDPRDGILRKYARVEGRKKYGPWTKYTKDHKASKWMPWIEAQDGHITWGRYEPDEVMVPRLVVNARQEYWLIDYHWYEVWFKEVRPEACWYDKTMGLYLTEREAAITKLAHPDRTLIKGGLRPSYVFDALQRQTYYPKRKDPGYRAGWYNKVRKDQWMRSPYGWVSTVAEVYGREWYCHKKRQISKSEMKRLGLVMPQ